MKLACIVAIEEMLAPVRSQFSVPSSSSRIEYVMEVYNNMVINTGLYLLKIERCIWTRRILCFLILALFCCYIHTHRHTYYCLCVETFFTFSCFLHIDYNLITFYFF